MEGEKLRWYRRRATSRIRRSGKGGEREERLPEDLLE